MILIKEGVDLRGVKPEMAAIGHSVVCSVFARYNFDAIITSGLEGDHLPNSKHKLGEALDYRSKHLPNMAAKMNVLNDLKKALGKSFYVILEKPNTDDEHYHVQFNGL